MVQTYKLSRDFVIWNQVAFNAGTLEENIERIYALPKLPYANYICLVGVPALVSAQKNVKLAEVFNNATMTVVDGMPIVKRARKLKLKCDRFSGPDFMRLFLEVGVKKNTRHFFYGCTDDVLQKIKKNMEENYHGIVICGTYAPPFRKMTPEEDKMIVEMIQAATPDFVWVGLGGEKQETWMSEHQSKLSQTTMLGVGAAFNYLAGTLQEMPQWMEEHSMGWLFRLIVEPKRLWRRYVLGGVMYLYYNMKYGFNAATRDRRINK